MFSKLLLIQLYQVREVLVDNSFDLLKVFLWKSNWCISEMGQSKTCLCLLLVNKICLGSPKKNVLVGTVLRRVNKCL